MSIYRHEGNADSMISHGIVGLLEETPPTVEMFISKHSIDLVLTQPEIDLTL